MPLNPMRRACRLPAGLSVRVMVGLLLLCLVPPALADNFSVCVSDEAFPPFTYPRQESESQQLIRRAGERQGLRVMFVAQPWRRCLAGVEHDVYSAVAGAAATAEYRAYMVFPLLAGQPDPRRALGVTRIMVFRRRDSGADWDGRRFRGLDKPLLYLSGRTTLKVLLDGLDVPTDDTARNSRQLAAMLLKGRGSLALDHEHQVERLLAMQDFHGQLEALPKPLAEGAVYLAVSRQAYGRNRAGIEAIWQAIGASQPGPAPMAERSP